MYKIGDKFILTGIRNGDPCNYAGFVYVLAQDIYPNFIKLKRPKAHSGWAGAKEVIDPLNITIDEFLTIAGDGIFKQYIRELKYDRITR